MQVNFVRIVVCFFFKASKLHPLASLLQGLLGCHFFAAKVRRNRNVLGDSQTRERARNLVSPRYTEPPNFVRWHTATVNIIQQNLTRGRLVMARDDIDKRGFTRAIGP